MSEKIINGNFQAGADGWTLNGHVTIEAPRKRTLSAIFNSGEHAPSNNNFITQNFTLSEDEASKDLKMSLFYGERGTNGAARVRVLYELIDPDGTVIDSALFQSSGNKSSTVSSDALKPGEYTIKFTDLSGGAASSRDPYVDDVSVIVCFAGGTSIATDLGEKTIDDINIADLVLTVDNGAQPVRWIGSSYCDASKLKAAPKLRPIRITAGALGVNTPARDLLVSPQHRILVASNIAKRMFGHKEVLVAAKHLVGVEGIYVDEQITEVSYYHMLFDRHELVHSNGAITESLYTGPEALRALDQEAYAEILTLMPEIASLDYEALACREVIGGRLGRKLAARHSKNAKPLVWVIQS